MSLKSGCLALALVATTVAGAHAAETTINLGHVTQPSHPFHTGAVMFEEAVEDATDGRIDIKVFPSRQLGDDKQLLEGVRLGTIDAAVISSAIFGGSTPLMDALQLPFLIESYEDLADAFTSPEGRALLDGLSEIGVKGLGYYEGGLRHFLANGRTIEEQADFSGLKTRVVPAKLHLDIWNAIGVSPTPMAYGEIYTSLQTGVLDATEINVTSIYSEKLYEVAQEVTLTGHYFWPGVLVFNPQVFAGLSDADQAAVVEAAQSTIRPQVAEAARLDAQALEKIRAAGATVAEFPDTAAIREALAPIYEAYEAKDPRVEAFAEAVRAPATN